MWYVQGSGSHTRDVALSEIEVWPPSHPPPIIQYVQEKRKPFCTLPHSVNKFLMQQVSIEKLVAKKERGPPCKGGLFCVGRVARLLVKMRHTRNPFSASKKPFTVSIEI